MHNQLFISILDDQDTGRGKAQSVMEYDENNGMIVAYVKENVQYMENIKQNKLNSKIT